MLMLLQGQRSLRLGPTILPGFGTAQSACSMLWGSAPGAAGTGASKGRLDIVAPHRSDEKDSDNAKSRNEDPAFKKLLTARNAALSGIANTLPAFQVVGGVDSASCTLPI
jgi:hypothetical protein